MTSPQALQGAFTDVLEGTVDRDSFLFKWLDYLSFALRYMFIYLFGVICPMRKTVMVLQQLLMADDVAGTAGG